MRSVHLHKDKSVFKVTELPADAFAAALGLAGAPKIKFLTREKAKEKKNASRVVVSLQAEVALENGESERNQSSSEDGEEDEGGDDDSGEGEPYALVEFEDLASVADAERAKVSWSSLSWPTYKFSFLFLRSEVFVLSMTACSGGRTKTYYLSTIRSWSTTPRTTANPMMTLSRSNALTTRSQATRTTTPTPTTWITPKQMTLLPSPPRIFRSASNEC
jgi:hypothetical protein